MKKTIFLCLLSLVMLVGCDKQSPDTTAGGGESGETAEAPNNEAGDETAAPTPGVTVGFEVGNQAPEITGEDIDGVAFKLSDYRGKVVVLDFWGDW